MTGNPVEQTAPAAHALLGGTNVTAVAVIPLLGGTNVTVQWPSSVRGDWESALVGA